MVEGLEGVGEAVTGGLVARAVEPGAGEAAGRETVCLNCGTALSGAYCHICGQHGRVHRTLGAFWHDIAHSVLHFDGKIWRTLPLLAWRPGELTHRYVEGERARFVSPMALFLFSVFLMFAVISTLGGPFDTSGSGDDVASARRELLDEQAQSKAKLERLGRKRIEAVAEGRSTAGTDADIAEAKRELALETRLGNAGVLRARKDAERDAASGDGKLNIGFRTGWKPLDSAIDKAEANPSLLLYKLQSNAYKFSWALIPISVPFLWLMFLHRRRYRQYRAYDHTVFVTYSIAFMSLGFIALSVLRPLGLSETWIGLAFVFVPPIHMYRQLRGAYRLSRWSALWRTLLLLNFAFVAAGLFLTLLVTLGVLG
jgi:hypothetical protein